jgi:5-methylthioadenosine/S-adenosylhomocysteine deaminase
VLGPGLIAVHAVHLAPVEIALLAKHRSTVAHCPSSNLKLASGLAPVAQLLAAGVNVALGTDGAASNNRLDLFEEMRLAALLAKAAAGSAEAMPAHAALRAATLGGAIALGLEARIGSIAPGKSADLAALSLDDVALQPVYDVVSHLVYACGREHVTDVWIAGERVLRDRQPTRLDLADLQARAGLWQTKILN